MTGIATIQEEIPRTLSGAIQMKDGINNISEMKLTGLSGYTNMEMKNMIQRFLACTTGKW